MIWITYTNLVTTSVLVLLPNQKTLFGKMEHVGITLDYVESQQKTFKLRLNQNKRNYTAYK